MRRTILTEEELMAFRRDGYLVMTGVFDADEAEEIRLWVDELEHLPEVPNRHMVYREASVDDPNKRVLDRIENFVPYHREFDSLLSGDRLLGSVSELFGEQAVLFKEKINFKLPQSRGFEPHQDMQAGWEDYGSLFITAAIAVDLSIEANGCLEIAPGCHDRGLIGKMWHPLGDEEIKDITFVPCPMEPGDVVFFDSFVPHRSAPNRSRWARRAIYASYNRLSEGDHRVGYFAAKRRSYPPDCERAPGERYEYKV
ncbi:MAG: phytanoyl-CoA dioxygenase family protein [Proteobacteria bacterium]|nr:phytanoyl-CoA dioxygenase family protein [Pseudomonadota bacterium]